MLFGNVKAFCQEQKSQVIQLWKIEPNTNVRPHEGFCLPCSLSHFLSLFLYHLSLILSLPFICISIHLPPSFPIFNFSCLLCISLSLSPCPLLSAMLPPPGLALVVGLVLYISTINDEMFTRTSSSEAFFNYKYGWSFAFAAISFLLTEVGHLA